MRLMLAALVATSVIAVTASVFAIWAGVTDAPWEDDVSRCQAALELRNDLRLSSPDDVGLSRIDLDALITDSQRLVNHAC